MQNGPPVSKADHASFNLIRKLFIQAFLIGRGDVTALHVAYTKSSKNFEKLTFDYGRFKSPPFLWLMQILKAVTMVMIVVTAVACFWSFIRNPAIFSRPSK
jgi:hypothetical protein